MTVAELIEELKQYDGNLPVVAHHTEFDDLGWDYDYYNDVMGTQRYVYQDGYKMLKGPRGGKEKLRPNYVDAVQLRG